MTREQSVKFIKAFDRILNKLHGVVDDTLCAHRYNFGTLQRIILTNSLRKTDPVSEELLRQSSHYVADNLRLVTADGLKKIDNLRKGAEKVMRKGEVLLGDNPNWDGGGDFVNSAAFAFSKIDACKEIIKSLDLQLDSWMNGIVLDSDSHRLIYNRLVNR